MPRSHTGGAVITCAGGRGRVQWGSEVVLIAHAHHRAFLLRHAVGRAGEALLLPGRHLVGARRARWRRAQEKKSDC